eukprot:767463-Hanusia_phi.AAC.6
MQPRNDVMNIRLVIDPDRLGEFSGFVHEMGQYAAACHPSRRYEAVQRMAFYGFGDAEFRGSFFRLLQSCFLCDWFWSSETHTNRWEMLVSFPTRHQFTLEHVERFCGFCKNGVACDALDRGITVPLARFFERIENGKNHVGWVRNRLRQACERRLQVMREQETGTRIRNETGLEFNSGNMLFIYHEWQNALVDLQESRNMCDEFDERVDMLLRTVHGMRESMQRSSLVIDRLRHALDTVSMGCAEYSSLQLESAVMSSNLQDMATGGDFSSLQPLPPPRS